MEQASKLKLSRTQRRDEAIKRQAAAYELRAKGYMYEEIAKELGYAGRAPAYYAVSRYIDKHIVTPTNERTKLLLVEQLEKLQSSLSVLAHKGNVKGANAVFKAIELKMKLLGLGHENFDITSAGQPINKVIEIIRPDDK